MANKVIKPKHLSNEAGALYIDTVTRYEIDDLMGRTILMSSCEAFDRMRQAQAIIKREGATIRDRHGIVRQHPASVIEKTSRTAMLQGFQALHLEPPKADK